MATTGLRTARGLRSRREPMVLLVFLLYKVHNHFMSLMEDLAHENFLIHYVRSLLLLTALLPDQKNRRTNLHFALSYA